MLFVLITDSLHFEYSAYSLAKKIYMAFVWQEGGHIARGLLTIISTRILLILVKSFQQSKLWRHQECLWSREPWLGSVLVLPLPNFETNFESAIPCVISFLNHSFSMPNSFILSTEPVHLLVNLVSYSYKDLYYAYYGSILKYWGIVRNRVHSVSFGVGWKWVYSESAVLQNSHKPQPRLRHCENQSLTQIFSSLKRWNR